MNLVCGNEVPPDLMRKRRLKAAEFLTSCAERLFQQYRRKAAGHAHVRSCSGTHMPHGRTEVAF
jgi:hypothetical protein